LLLSQILRNRGWPHGIGASLGGAAMAVAVAAASPTAGAFLFVTMLLTAIAALLKSRSFMGAAGCGLMLLNVILVRQSAVLGPDISWHLYHVIVAVWLWCTAKALRAGAVH